MTLSISPLSLRPNQSSLLQSPSLSPLFSLLTNRHFLPRATLCHCLPRRLTIFIVTKIIVVGSLSTHWLVRHHPIVIATTPTTYRGCFRHCRQFRVVNASIAIVFIATTTITVAAINRPCGRHKSTVIITVIVSITLFAAANSSTGPWSLSPPTSVFHCQRKKMTS